jgi:hypothetical protein
VVAVDGEEIDRSTKEGLDLGIARIDVPRVS